jgi:hypothetical protein
MASYMDNLNLTLLAVDFGLDDRDLIAGRGKTSS